MAGVTNVAFRTLCRELELARAGTVSGLYVCEMVTARALVERHPVTMHMTTFAPDESPRSLQLYTVDPDTTFAAAKMIADEGMADHIDMNFGCPVPKVTRRGGGAALPFKRRLFGQIVAAAVRGDRRHRHPGHREVPDRHRRRAITPTSTPAASPPRRARPRSRCTPAPRRSATPAARIGTRSPSSNSTSRAFPVLGNGDIFDADDALAMMAATGCDGVVIGRGCLGRPWLFAELSAAFTGRDPGVPPTLGEVADIIRRHGELLAAHFGEDKGMRDIRKHIAWYLHGFPAGADLRRALALVKTLSELDALLGQLDPDVPFPAAATGPRGTSGLTGVGDPPGGLAERSRRLHGARRSRRYALRRLNRDGLDITSSQLVSVRCGSRLSGSGGGAMQSAATRQGRHSKCRESEASRT